MLFCIFPLHGEKNSDKSHGFATGGTSKSVAWAMRACMTSMKAVCGGDSSSLHGALQAYIFAYRFTFLLEKPFIDTLSCKRDDAVRSSNMHACMRANES
jgi:hypothetical protein